MKNRNPVGIDTPCLLIDLDVVENNLAGMQARATRHGVSLRPHLKAHKIPELAHRQIDMGANGVTVSKLSEAEIMADSGLNDIFIAYQVVSEGKLKRLLNLSRRITVSVGLDSVEGAHILSRVFSAAGVEIPYLIEIDSGLERCGVLPGKPAVELFKAIRHLPAIRFKGLFTHAGQSYGKQSLDEIQEVSRYESRAVAETALEFKSLGIYPEILSVGSTPTMKVWEGYAGINEIRPGNYIFHDAIQLSLGTAKPEECALTVLATVISRPGLDRAVIDAGSKVLALDKGAHGTEMVKGFGLVRERKAVIERLSEEHGIMSLAPAEKLAIGETVRIIPNHACTVINLFDKAYGLRGDKVETEFKIAGRGKSQ